MTTTEPVLCYVRHGHAWFTTCPLGKQWGDDWNNAPYEHNAGQPYDWRPYMRDRGIEPYEITEVYFDGPFEEPCEGKVNSQWSVEQINAGRVPWVAGSRWGSESVRGVRIMAGTSISEFRRIVREVGGRVFVEDTSEITTT